MCADMGVKMCADMCADTPCASDSVVVVAVVIVVITVTIFIIK